MAAATIMPATLAVILRLFPAEGRARAIASWAAASGLPISLGPLLGGALLSAGDGPAGAGCVPDLAFFERIDGFDNSRRVQERLGRLSPIEFGEKYYADRAAAEQVNPRPRQLSLTR
ncbi:hypothetical protein ACFV6E_22880 [Streptomyces sp. NPDC059785]|uniref:hypothetical protein n=1 Tax=unclassified Streptomyces TaxID=2593676 RepID=UPI00364FCD49